MANQYIKEMPKGMIEELDRRLEERIKKIRATESEWTVSDGGKVYYVSNAGNDNNDGLSEAAPLATIEKLMEMQKDETLKHGDVILFRRGDEWHCQYTMKPGLTLSAYGEGDKPRILGSYEADRAEQWIPTELENVYKFEKNFPIEKDIGNIVFDNGRCHGQRVLKSYTEDMTLTVGRDNLASNGLNNWIFEPRACKDYTVLADIGRDIPEADLMFYHDYHTGELYLYCRQGNPGNVFFSVELCQKGNAIRATSDVVVDNLFVGMTGAHGIGSGSCKNLIVRNCEVAWIGGSIQFIRNDRITRYGNAVEIYGQADGYKVYNCYMYQCFDCGPTVQWSGNLPEGRCVVEKDIEFYGNALREASLEIWMTTSSEQTDTWYAKLINCKMYDNLVTMSGYGWKGYNHQKNEWCSFYGAGESKAEHRDCYMENNYFWNLRRHVMKAVPTTTKQGLGFHWRNNTIIKDYGSSFGWMGADLENAKGAYVPYTYNDETIGMMLENGALGENNNFYYIPEGGRSYTPSNMPPDPYMDLR